MPTKDAPDLRKETETYINKAREAAEVQENRATYPDTFLGGQVAAFRDVQEFLRDRVGRDRINTLNDVDHYLRHRIDPSLPGVAGPRGMPEARTADPNPPVEHDEGSPPEPPADRDDSGETEDAEDPQASE